MRAIVKDGDHVELWTRPAPEASRASDVVIRVAYAGICRTDLAVAEGRIGSGKALTLGHEFSGRVEQVGSAVTRVKRGDRVTAMPIYACASCHGCQHGLGTCEFPTMLGVEHDGAFAEYVVVPERVVHAIPEHLDLQRAAYTEPVAASLAVTKARISPGEKGAIVGANRIAELTRRVMLASGFQDLEVLDTESLSGHATSSYDYVIETLIDTAVFKEIVRIVKPQGRIVLKSRQPDLVGLYFPALLRKELTIEAVNYGSFERSIQLLADSPLRVDDLFGRVYPLDAFRAAFDAARGGEAKKLFFSMASEAD